MTTTDTSPALAVDLAASCVEFVRRAVGVAPDFTAETLPLVDHYLGQAAVESRGRPEASELVARAVGAYFGELLRRDFDCWWYAEGDDLADWRIRFRPVYLELSPYALAAAALGLPGADEAGFALDPDDIEFIGAHLASLPPLPEDEHRLLSTRHEVLEIVADQLKGRAVARHLGDVAFEDADYDEG